MTDQLHDAIAAANRESGDLRALFDGLDDGLAFVEPDGAVSLCNPAFERWAGRDVPVGAKLWGLFRAPLLLDAVDRAQEGESTLEELKLGGRTVLMSARPHRGGTLLVLHDLTALRRMEGVRRDFVANVSHELKTPLTSIVGFAEALTEGELPAEQSRAFGERILANATRMRRLVEDLLDLAMVESGSWSPAQVPVSISETAQAVWAGMSTEVYAKTRLVVEGTGRLAYADPNALRQILGNLLDNAARHSERSEPIRVRVHEDGLAVRTEVTDQGPGIPSAYLGRVFERFYRVDPARSRAQGGTGLGLAIVKHLVVSHGGEVGIESRVGCGTTVWFTLPMPAGTFTTPTPG